ncbi:MAG: glycoside hydrolase family 3 C-terminal domain-containing protein, partial [Calditrichaceae bacterium]
MQQAAPGTDIIYSEDGVIADTTADVAVAVIGETPYAEGNGDRDDLNLSSPDINLVKRLKSAGLPVIVILISGRPMLIEPVIPYSDAVIAAWLPGTEGQGIADILFGDYNPSGKLSHSWPKSMDDIPVNTGDADYDPLFDYGFGLTSLDDSPQGSAPEVYSALIASAGELNLSFNKNMAIPVNAAADFHLEINGSSGITLDSISVNQSDPSTLILHLNGPVEADDRAVISYSGETVFAEDGGQLQPFDSVSVYNGLIESTEALNIPGKIEAEDYFDMSGIQTENTTDAGGGLNVGYIDDGDWMSYRINALQSSYYRIILRVASESSGGLIQFKKDGEVLADVDVPVTGAWQSWTDVVTFIYLDAGVTELQLYADKGGFNVNWLNFEMITSINTAEN